jgi:hypothetical protein
VAERLTLLAALKPDENAGTDADSSLFSDVLERPVPTARLALVRHFKMAATIKARAAIASMAAAYASRCRRHRRSAPGTNAPNSATFHHGGLGGAFATRPLYPIGSGTTR